MTYSRQFKKMQKNALNSTNNLNLYTKRYALFGILFGLAFPVIGILLTIYTSKIPFTFATLIRIQVNNPLLWVIDTAPVVLGVIAAYAGRKQDMLESVNETLRMREFESETHQYDLEQQVNKRTEELTLANENNMRRSSQFEGITRIAHAISTTETQEELLPLITEVISEQLGFYHTGIFLIDEAKEYAILVAANSQGGQKMLQRQHKLRIGGIGIVGNVTKTGKPRIALDVGLDAIYFNNPDLPDTHSEMALPLTTGFDIFGALDVQSTEKNAFSSEDINILSILADLVSVAIQNVRFRQQSLEALSRAESASLQFGQQQWSSFHKNEIIPSYQFDGVNTHQVGTSFTDDIGQLVIPLKLRGIRIGSLKLSSSEAGRSWTEDEIALAEATAERTALAVENARLLKEAQKRASKERTIGNIAAKLGSLVNIDNIVQTTIQELGNNLPGTEIAIQFKQSKSDS